jgi:hypothetical protein
MQVRARRPTDLMENGGVSITLETDAPGLGCDAALELFGTAALEVVRAQVGCQGGMKGWTDLATCVTFLETL